MNGLIDKVKKIEKQLRLEAKEFKFIKVNSEKEYKAALGSMEESIDNNNEPIHYVVLRADVFRD